MLVSDEQLSPAIDVARAIYSYALAMGVRRRGAVSDMGWVPRASSQWRRCPRRSPIDLRGVRTAGRHGPGPARCEPRRVRQPPGRARIMPGIAPPICDPGGVPSTGRARGSPLPPGGAQRANGRTASHLPRLLGPVIRATLPPSSATRQAGGRAHQSAPPTGTPRLVRPLCPPVPGGRGALRPPLDRAHRGPARWPRSGTSTTTPGTTPPSGVRSAGDGERLQQGPQGLAGHQRAVDEESGDRGDHVTSGIV